ncbi:phytoene desaturase family protein [Actomonas aquatica]|uniref:NAD(P)/FAD-dependent oxidoreductase n=1 Tax=Actomonas aquatica TaxID=2866162 RepID=A0ABZ1CA08_9BACT|nr:NAD(P)/FAD-dependent oxidoreductase [Opitutus sp. WL0086]WRQ88306.1 NAD(P)/FAD-dependent oxidoreductase [Opitutus sp. WL0086]
MNTSDHYDVVIIGAGMSGLAAGIRLAHFGKKVCIFERHNAVGGLNSFYSQAGRKFDVGLHALTNFVRPGVKGTPLGKLLRQLRIRHEEFELSEQKRSRVAFGPNGETSLAFTNDFAVFESEVARAFPAQIDGFRQLVATVRTYDDVSLDAQPVSAREVVRRYISDPLLEDMIFCPVMYYGSAQERDMEFGQFVIMFKALFLEGFARPFDGVRVILRVLVDKYRAAGGERRMKCGVKRVIAQNGKATALELDSGDVVTADHVISSIGGPETERLIGNLPAPEQAPSPVGALSFVETITILDRQPAALGWGDDTIVFFNDSARFDYAAATDAVDPRSGVICFPNNFAYADGAELPEGVFRCTCLANYQQWTALPEDDYRAAKAAWFERIQQSARRFLPMVADEALMASTITTDMFTPRTVEKYTGHFGGAIYGSPLKHRQGRTALDNVYLCGTDQGFLGIIGAMLSGISMANYHVLRG